MEDEIVKDIGEPAISLAPDETKGRPVSVGEIIRQCNFAASRMGNKNPHKFLILTCAYALKQLVERIAELENPKGGIQ